jgi:hypothetical protein
MYYANFLIPVLSQNIHNYRISYDEKCINKYDDAFIWTHIKENDYEDEKLKTLKIELLERKYKKSLIKSLPEFDVIFENCSKEYKSELIEKFREKIKETYCVKDTKNQKSAGYLEKNFIKEVIGNKLSKSISDIVWIDAYYTHKKINLKTTYLVYPNKITTLDRIDLLNSQSLDNETPYYFYLYYDLTEEDKDSSIKKDMQKAIEKYASRLSRSRCR